MDIDEPLCTICHIRPVREKKKFVLHGVHVCRTCLYRFANRRQAAFIGDMVVWGLVMFLLRWVVQAFVRLSTPGWVLPDSIDLAFSVLGLVLFTLKDGFSGQSPGKIRCGVQVVDAKTMEPIGFGASFLRNLPILILYVPNDLARLVGILSPASRVGAIGAIANAASVFGFIGLLTIASRLVKGPRWGDGWAGTKVVWKKYAYRPPFDNRGEACTNCGYNLRGNISGVCPECGMVIFPA